MNCWNRTLEVVLVVSIGVVASSVDVARAQDLPGVGGFPGVGQPQQGPPEISDEDQQKMQTLLNEALQATASGKALVEQGDLDGAIDKFDETIQKTNEALQTGQIRQLPGIEDPRFEAAFQKGKAQREQGYLQDAYATLQSASTLANTEFTSNERIGAFIVELGQVAAENEDYNTAIAVLTNGLRSPGQGKNAELWFNKGKAVFDFVKTQQYASPQEIQEQAESAIQSFDRAIRINPQYAEALLERGLVHASLGDFETAMEDFESAVDADPANTDAVLQLGKASYSRAAGEINKRNGQQAAIDRDLQQALAQMNSFLQQVPPRAPGEKDEEPEKDGHEDVLYQRSLVYIALGDEAPAGSGSGYYQNALEDAKKVVELEPDSYAGYLQKAKALRMLGDLDGALTALGETLDLAPNNPEALLRRGIIHFRQGDYEGAMADFRPVILYSRDSHAHFWMALCYSRQDNPRMAIKHYSNAVQFRPSFNIALFNRGLAHMKIGRYEQARADFAAVVRNDANNQEARALRDRAAALQHTR